MNHDVFFFEAFEEEPRIAAALRAGSAASGDRGLDALLRLRGRDDVILTPHNAFNTREAVARKCEQTAAQLKSLFETGEFIWNAP